MQNLRSYSCSIVKLKLGANEAQWRADVLAASSLYGADHLLSGVHLSLTQEQFERDILPLNEMSRDPRDPNMPKLEPSSTTMKQEEQGSPVLEHKTSHLRSTWSIPEYPDSLDQESTGHVEEQVIIDQLGPYASSLTTEKLAQRKYARTLMQQGMRSRRIYVRWNKNTQLYEDEGQLDQLRRTLLGKKMRDSLGECPHLLRDLGEYDIAAMWDTVAQLEQPEPYELLVRDIKRLTKYEKKQDVSLQAWLVGLEEIYDSLQAVQFPVTDMLRIGFLLTLLESDTRFAAIIKEAKSKRWSYAKCLTKFGRHAVLIKDTAADSASKSPTKKAHEQNATDTSRKGKGHGRGGKGSGRGSKDRPQSDDSEEISKLKKHLQQAKAQIVCPREKKGLDCDTPRCPHKHSAESKGKRSDSEQNSDKKKKDSSGKKSDQATKPKLGTCYVYAENGSCPREPNCPYSHEKHEQSTLTHALAMHELDKRALENIAPIAKKGDLIEISKDFSGHYGVYATMISSSIVTYGKEGPTRVYQLDMSRALADKIHPGFHHELSYGIPERCITNVSTSNHEVHLHGSKKILPTFDSASTVDMINTDQFFWPGTVRDTNIQVAFNDSTHSAVKPAKSGIVLFATKVPNRFIARRMLHHPRAKRTIISIPKLRDLGFAFDLQSDHMVMHKGGVALLHIPRNNRSNGTTKEVDDDSYVTSFDILPDDSVVNPAKLGAVLYNTEVPDSHNGDVLLPSRDRD